MPSIFVTGANRGLGLEFARQYANQGWHVWAACRYPGAANELKEIAARFSNVALLDLDVTDSGSLTAARRSVGASPIDVLLNNAGVNGPSVAQGNAERQEFGSIDYDAWVRTLLVNTLAPMQLFEAFAGNVENSERRILATVTSALGSIARSNGGKYAYRTSKAAANMVVKTLAADLHDRGVTTAAFCPGWVKTRMGGADAPLEAVESVAGMRRVIDGLTLQHSGRFWSHTGDEIPW